MKKLILFSVIFALVAGAVFAQEVNFGGLVIGKVNVIDGTTKENDKDYFYAGGNTHVIRLTASGQNEEGTFGAWVRMHGSWGGGVNAFGYGWWKPIDMLKLQIGSNPDGNFGLDGVTRWGFYQEASNWDVGVVNEGGAFGASFFAGCLTDGGSIVTITPVDGLEINVGVPFVGDNGSKRTYYIYGDTVAQVKYTMEGIGTFGLTFEGGRGDEVKISSGSITGNGAKLYAYAGLALIEGLGIDLGLSYTLPSSEGDEKTTGKYTYNAPIAVGLGAQYAITEEFGIKTRVQGKFAEKAKFERWGSSQTQNGDFELIADVLPYYAINESITAYLSAGLAFSNPDNGDSYVDWHLNPYLTIKEGNAGFYAGFQVHGYGKRKVGNVVHQDAFVNWAVPIGILYSF